MGKSNCTGNLPQKSHFNFRMSITIVYHRLIVAKHPICLSKVESQSTLPIKIRREIIQFEPEYKHKHFHILTALESRCNVKWANSEYRGNPRKFTFKTSSYNKERKSAYFQGSYQMQHANTMLRSKPSGQLSSLTASNFVTLSSEMGEEEVHITTGRNASSLLE